MKLNTVISHEAEYLGEVQENRVGIDKSNLDFITTLLTSNLYSNPLESFLRETVSNAYDSHVEAGTDEPILLLIEDLSTYENYRISIRDYGTGVSPERFEQIYKNIGSSTKRESNDYIGMFGIGRFSCLSCADTANITSYYNGVKYSYIMYKNGGGINIDMISSSKGDYKDGLEVSIEYRLSYSEFRDAIRGLSLFDKLHIVYKGDKGYIKDAVNNFNNRVVARCKTFCYCSLLGSYRNYFKVGNVLYSSDSGVNLQTKGLIIDLPIGSVDITPNREALQFTEYTKNTIKSQTELVKQELQELINAHINRGFTLEQFCGDIVYRSCIPINISPDVNHTANILVDKHDVNIDISKITIEKENLPKQYIKFIEVTRYMEIPKDIIHKVISKYRGFKRGLGNLWLNEFTLIEKQDKVTKQITQNYISENLTKDALVLIFDGIAALKDKIVSWIKDGYLSLTDSEINACIEFSLKHIPVITMANDSVPQYYIDSHKAAQKSKRAKVDTSKIPVRLYGKYGYVQRYIQNLPDEGLIIYTTNVIGSDERDTSLRELAGILAYSSSIAGVITVKKEIIPILEANKRCVAIEKFMYSKNKVLVKLVTGIIISENLRKAFNRLERGCSGLPLGREFLRKYKSEFEMSLDSVSSRQTVMRIINYYKLKNWVNQADINYFNFSEKELVAAKGWEEMKIHSNEIIRKMALRKYGKLPKIGLTIWPKT